MQCAKPKPIKPTKPCRLRCPSGRGHSSRAPYPVCVHLMQEVVESVRDKPSKLSTFAWRNNEVCMSLSGDFQNFATAACFARLNHYRSEFPHFKACYDQVNIRSSFDEHRQILQFQRLTDEKIEAATERFGASSVRPQGSHRNGFRRAHMVLHLVRADALTRFVAVHLFVVRKQAQWLSLSKLNVTAVGEN
jgi:hypothetical protein